MDHRMALVFLLVLIKKFREWKIETTDKSRLFFTQFILFGSVI